MQVLELMASVGEAVGGSIQINNHELTNVNTYTPLLLATAAVWSNEIYILQQCHLTQLTTCKPTVCMQVSWPLNYALPQTVDRV